MQIALPSKPIGLILLPNKNREIKIIATCFTLPTTFIINGPPSLTALKLATFRRKARKPQQIRMRILDQGGLDRRM